MKRSKNMSVPYTLGIVFMLLTLSVASATSLHAEVNSIGIDHQSSKLHFGALGKAVALSADNIWTVGGYSNDQGYNRTLTEHWNGVKWSVVKSPNANTGNNDLFGIAAVSVSNIWAVGSSSGTLIEHWNGSKWRIVPSPSPGVSANLYAVAAISTNDIWAVGNYFTRGLQQELDLIEHWDGSQWSIVPGPNPSNTSNILEDVTGVSTSDLWAVGYYTDNNGAYQTLIEHWNGAKWSIVTSPRAGLDPTLFAVAALSSNNVWTVGNNLGPNLYLTLVEHWDGNAWSIVKSPSPGQHFNQLRAVGGVYANDIWAVGAYDNINTGPTKTLTEHWNGTRWSIVKSPSLGSASPLAGVAAIAVNNIWAMGGGYSGTLIEHWNGSKWRIIPSP